MIYDWDILDNSLPDVNVSNHSSLMHKGRIALKINDPSKEARPEDKGYNSWYYKNPWKKKSYKRKRPETIVYTDGKKHLSEETRRKISLNHADMRGSKNPMFGRKHSPETIMKLKMLCRNMQGENNPMHGKKHTEDTKLKMAKKKNKPLLVEGRFFESIKEAMRNIVISINDLKTRISEKVPGYKFLDKDEIKQYI